MKHCTLSLALAALSLCLFGSTAKSQSISWGTGEPRVLYNGSNQPVAIEGAGTYSLPDGWRVNELLLCWIDQSNGNSGTALDFPAGGTWDTATDVLPQQGSVQPVQGHSYYVYAILYYWDNNFKSGSVQTTVKTVVFQ